MCFYIYIYFLVSGNILNKSLFMQVEIAKNLLLFGKTMLREEIDASEWNVGKPNQDSTMGSWDDIHRLLVW